MLGERVQREERLLSWTRVCVDRVRAFYDLSEGLFPLPSLPNSGTTGVAQEPRSCMPDSTITC
jgi:hypothetical protein